MKKRVLAAVLGLAMVVSMMAGCGSKEKASEDTYKVAIVKQMDHASLDEIANAIAAELDAKIKQTCAKHRDAEDIAHLLIFK